MLSHAQFIAQDTGAGGDINWIVAALIALIVGVGAGLLIARLVFGQTVG